MKISTRNLVNTGIVLLALLLVVSCVFNTRREADVNSSNSNVNAANVTRSDSSESKRLKNDDNGDFIVKFADKVDPRFADIDAKIRQEKLLEKAADNLNSALGLPADVFMRTAECGQANAEFDPNTQTITVCYELISYFNKIFANEGLSAEQAEKKSFDAARFAFLHEVAHALIENYGLPVTGGEEDAADRCSAYINIVELRQSGVDSVIAAAEAFRIESKRRPAKTADTSGGHLIDERRAHDSLCMIYGSAPEKYGYFVTAGYLPAARAENCRDEYLRMTQSWESLLRPWRKGE